MIIKHHYWYFKEAVPKETCEAIVRAGLNKIPTMGRIKGTKADTLNSSCQDPSVIDEIKQYRDSNVSWLNERWLYELLQSHMDEANQRAGWNLDWDWSEDLQFTVYKPGQFYNWHADQNDQCYDGDLATSNYAGKYRKLSVILSLSDPKDYVGGELEFDMGKLNPTRICSEIKPQGSIVVFPSFVYHRVHPVTWGTRYSLVMWTLGKPYR
jgi:PKHD-type hydroxylase